MTLPELAKQLGVTTTKLRKRAAAAGIVTTDRTGHYVELPEDAHTRLSVPIGAITAAHAVTASQGGVGTCRLPDTPGLPLDALGDPAFRETFTLMRFQREERLMSLVSAWRCG